MKGGWQEGQQAGKQGEAGVEPLECGWLKEQQAGKAGPELVQGGWLEHQQAGKAGAELLHCG